MERRDFMRGVLGVAAVTALPSEVWPFRKIFVMPAPELRIVEYADTFHLGTNYYSKEAIRELEKHFKITPLPGIGERWEWER